MICTRVQTLLGQSRRQVPDGRAGAFKVARLALVKDVFQFGSFDYSEERVEIRRVEVLLHYNLMKVVTYRQNYDHRIT